MCRALLCEEFMLPCAGVQPTLAPMCGPGWALTQISAGAASGCGVLLAPFSLESKSSCCVIL